MTTTTELVLLAGIPLVFIVASALHSYLWHRRLGRKLDAMCDKMQSRTLALSKPED